MAKDVWGRQNHENDEVFFRTDWYPAQSCINHDRITQMTLSFSYSVMDTKHLKKIQENEVLRKRLAKFMTKFCFRNSKLENFHDWWVPIFL